MSNLYSHVLIDVTGEHKSKMAAAKPEVLISQLIYATSPTELLDPENIGIASGIPLLFSTEAEILRYFISKSGNGGHL